MDNQEKQKTREKFLCPRHGVIEDVIHFYKDGKAIKSFCCWCILAFAEANISEAKPLETRGMIPLAGPN